MDEKLKSAIQRRIELGHSREQIIEELVATGYTQTTAKQFHDEVAASPSPLPGPEPIQPTNQPEVVGTPAGLSTPARSNMWPIIILVGLLVLAGGAAAFWLTIGGGLSPFDTKPYATESELLGGVVQNNRERTAFGFNLDYELALEPQDPGSPTVSDALLSKEELDGIAQMLQYSITEGSAKFTASGLIDARNAEMPEFDISMQLNLLAEPFIINTAASLRAANGNLYGKIDRIPANLQMFTGDVPEDTWILLEEGDVVIPDADTSPVPAQALELYDEFLPEVVKIYGQSMYQLAAFGGQKVGNFVTTNNSRQMASGMAAFGLDASLSTEEREIASRSLELLQQYPPIKFVGEAEKMKVNDETVYQYEIDIDYDNLRPYYISVTREAERISGDSLGLTDDELMDFLPSRAVIAEANRLTDLLVQVRPDGTLAGIQLEGVLAADHDDIDSQLRLSASFSPTRQNDGVNIEPPETIHPKTLEEILFEGPLGEARTAGTNASIKQGLSTLRVQAELIYSEDGFTYAGVCQSQSVQQLLNAAAETAEVYRVAVDSQSSATQVTCNDGPESYAMVVPLFPNQATAWCVDSTGFAGEVLPETLSTDATRSCGARLPATSGGPAGPAGSGLNDESIKNGMGGLVQRGVRVADTAGGDYSQVCQNGEIDSLLKALGQLYSQARPVYKDTNSSSNYVLCNDTAEGFAISAPTIAGDMAWCVDSFTGVVRTYEPFQALGYQSVACGN